MIMRVVPVSNPCLHLILARSDIHTHTLDSSAFLALLHPFPSFPSYTMLYPPLHSTILQLIPHPPTTQIRHRHNLHHQTRPAREMLRALPFAGFGIILFPRKARLLPAVVDGGDEVGAEVRVQFSCARLVGAFLLGDGLVGRR